MRCFSLLLLAIVLFSPIQAQAAPPNVVLIISDDQAWDDYSFMGHPHIKTPHLDRLAAESLTFTRGYVPDSLCRPSLVTMITGLYPHQHGVVGNDPPPPAALAKLSKPKQRATKEYLDIRNKYLEHIDDDPKLAEILKKKGYISHQSGKWWEGHYTRGGFTHGMTHGDRSKGGRHGDNGLKIGRQGIKPVTDFINRAVDEKKPFFVYYAPFLPHSPHNPPERILKKYRDKTPYLPIAKYWAMCEWFDETCGELIDFIDNKGLGKETIFLYVCDNGWINNKENGRYAPRSKRSQYDGGLRTPIMVRWTGKVKPQMDRIHLASSIDLVPTVLTAVGLEDEITCQMQGINLLDSAAVNNRKIIFGEILEHDIQDMTDPVASLKYRWAIENEWKLILPHAARVPNGEIELFNLIKDPYEKKNLASSHPEIVKSLTKKIDAWWKVD